MNNRYIAIIRLFLFGIFIVIGSSEMIGQTPKDTSSIWRVEMKDGNVFIGKILTENSKAISLKTEYLGTLALRKKDIEFREKHDERKMLDGKVWRENKVYGKYILSPTGFLHEKGKGYYENKYVFINHINVATSDRSSIGVGLVPGFLIDGSSTPVWLTAQFQLPSKNKNLHISVGGFIASFLFDEYTGNIGIVNAVGTYGNKNINFSTGIGYGSFDGEWMRGPSFSFSGSIRVARRTYLFSENILNHVQGYRTERGQFYMFVIGGRTIWRKISLDYGLLAIKDTEMIMYYNDQNLGALPYLGIVVPFN